MDYKELSQRWKAAREVYNIHGHQSPKAVYTETKKLGHGFPDSKILAMETYTEDKYVRNVGYLDAAFLADYYGVSLDWIMCRPGAVPRVDANERAAAEYTGLTGDTVKAFHDKSQNKAVQNFASDLMTREESLMSQPYFAEMAHYYDDMKAGLYEHFYELNSMKHRIEAHGEDAFGDDFYSEKQKVLYDINKILGKIRREYHMHIYTYSGYEFAMQAKQSIIDSLSSFFKEIEESIDKKADEDSYQAIKSDTPIAGG